MGCKGSKHALHGGGGAALEPRKCASGLVARHSVALRSSTLGTLSLDRATAAAAVSFAGGEGAGATATTARPGKEGVSGRCRSFAGWFPASPKVEPGQPVKRQRLAPPRTPTKTPARDPEEINVWELMDGLDDDGAEDEEYDDCLDGQVPSACGSPEFDPDVLSAFREALAELSPPHPDADVVSDGGAVVKKEEIQVLDDVASDGGAVVKKEEIQVLADVASDGGAVVKKEEIQVFGGAIVKKEEIQVFADVASDGGAIVKKEEIQVFAGVVRARLDVLQGRIDSRSQKNPPPPPPPPESARRVVVYLTSLRGIRQTYEDCWAASTILSSYGVHVDERDLSMHAGYKEELRDALGAGAPASGTGVLPQVFVDGWHLGGAEEVRRMHESGELAEALEACEPAPGAAGGGKEGPGGFAAEPCGGCGGARFVPCDVCSGSCKVFVEDEDGPGAFRRCPDCNENGLLRCPIC
ncbi:hypothetical protein CFC21_101892 [Triticum aestivum]|uniref:Glutaredoxin domain-containing protein n=2 Tax=Triticum aestivum TaxID=4565 RepID=A0A9R1M481_WHEAT|nr:uncharacterized protein LOC119340260 [Triticum dicoccoides]XP_044434598.1 uncharacterized protein LOC123160829 [Triticum aestivum]KAF7100366.1 hypothetical protein CFC21_101892 [Triticum aestivum]